MSCGEWATHWSNVHATHSCRMPNNSNEDMAIKWGGYFSGSHAGVQIPRPVDACTHTQANTGTLCHTEPDGPRRQSVMIHLIGRAGAGMVATHVQARAKRLPTHSHVCTRSESKLRHNSACANKAMVYMHDQIAQGGLPLPPHAHTCAHAALLDR